ncbi:MAG: hypothetical protein WBN06_12015 [Lysobacterales bacterium]
MNNFANNSRVGLLGVVCGLLLLSACATSVSTENQIEQRVTARWETLLSGDLAGAYEYLSPGYRSSVSLMQYQRSVLLQQVKWTSAKYVESTCEETTCSVKVLVGFTVYGALPGVKSFNGTKDIEESWVLISGNWYLVPPQ